ncbi:hypothetical protein DXC92_04450 [Clostridiales bacterium TF09-2AC]|nr:hypothetical protein DXC92_04450 [Clostridiales bacterium TF09-2AC]
MAVRGLPGAGGGRGKKEPKEEGICWRKGRGPGPEDGQQGGREAEILSYMSFLWQKVPVLLGRTT